MMRGLGSYLYVEELLTGQQGQSKTCHFETQMRGPKLTIENVTEHNDKNNVMLAEWDQLGHDKSRPTMGKGEGADRSV